MPTPDREYLLIPDAVREHFEQLDDWQQEVLRRVFLIAPQTADCSGEPAEARVEQRPIGAYTAPQPPPVDMPVDPAKWASLSRKRRRQLIRYHRKQVRGQ